MRCIQGSDAHRLTQSSRNKRNLGIGERMTEILLPEVSFEALREVLQGNDFSRTRPYRASQAPVDFVQSAREEGPSIVQSFHEKATKQGGRLYAIIADVCAFANANGGTVYVGANANPKTAPAGVKGPNQLAESLLAEIEHKISPELAVESDVQETKGVSVIRLIVPRGTDPPYAIDDNKIYVRDEADTSLAVRDEIVGLVKRALVTEAPVSATPAASATSLTPGAPAVAAAAKPQEPAGATESVPAPRTGVEIVQTEVRKGVTYHYMRDLRNGNVVKNVTRKSARRLWHYAIAESEKAKGNHGNITWHGDLGVVKEYKQSGRQRYDLAQRAGGGQVRVYYGVTEDGMSDEWLHLLPPEES
jgi:hypothetical protein